jgi:3-oxoacid CoA-transferase
MEHCTKNGKSKILNKCTLPLTGARTVSTIITELAVFKVDRKSGNLRLIDIAEGATVEEVKSKTEADFIVSESVGRF